MTPPPFVWQVACSGLLMGLASALCALCRPRVCFSRHDPPSQVSRLPRLEARPEVALARGGRPSPVALVAYLDALTRTKPRPRRLAVQMSEVSVVSIALSLPRLARCLPDTLYSIRPRRTCQGDRQTFPNFPVTRGNAPAWGSRWRGVVGQGPGARGSPRRGDRRGSHGWYEKVSEWCLTPPTRFHTLITWK